MTRAILRECHIKKPGEEHAFSCLTSYKELEAYRNLKLISVVRSQGWRGDLGGRGWENILMSKVSVQV